MLITLKIVFKKSDALMLANDNTIIATNTSLAVLFDVVNKKVTNVDCWLTANKLSLNVTKTN